MSATLRIVRLLWTTESLFWLYTPAPARARPAAARHGAPPSTRLVGPFVEGDDLLPAPGAGREPFARPGRPYHEGLIAGVLGGLGLPPPAFEDR